MKNNIRSIALFIVPLLILPGCSIVNWFREKLDISKQTTMDRMDPRVPNTYNGIPINPYTLYTLSSEYSPMPSKDRLKLDQWTSKTANKNLLKQLSQFQFKNKQEFHEKFQHDNQRIQQARLKNKSAANYVFHLPNLDYFIKIAGPLNRAQSALMERGIWPGQKPTPEILNEVLSGKIPTYQTASRIAYFLILQELKRTQDLEHIATQDTHLIYYPGALGIPDDNNVFIVQKALPKNMEKLTSKRLKELPNDMIEDLVQAIIGAALWSIKGNVFIDNKNEMLYLIDLEQPNNSAPKDFFHQDPVRYYGNINAGLEHVLDMLQGDSDKLLFVRSVVESHPLMKSPNYPARYKRELIQMLNQKAPKQ